MYFKENALNICCLWLKSLHMIHYRTYNAQKVTVWCALWLGGIILLTFLTTMNVSLSNTVHREHSMRMITNIFGTKVGIYGKTCGKTRRCNLTYIGCSVRRFAYKIHRLQYFTIWWRKLASKFMPFNAIDLFFVWS